MLGWFVLDSAAVISLPNFSGSRWWDLWVRVLVLFLSPFLWLFDDLGTYYHSFPGGSSKSWLSNSELASFFVAWTEKNNRAGMSFNTIVKKNTHTKSFPHYQVFICAIGWSSSIARRINKSETKHFIEQLICCVCLRLKKSRAMEKHCGKRMSGI